MIDKDFLNKIILKVKEDQKYLNFYNDYLKEYLELDINETLMIISNNIFKNVDEYILKKLNCYFIEPDEAVLNDSLLKN